MPVTERYLDCLQSNPTYFRLQSCTNNPPRSLTLCQSLSVTVDKNFKTLPQGLLSHECWFVPIVALFSALSPQPGEQVLLSPVQFDRLHCDTTSQ